MTRDTMHSIAIACGVLGSMLAMIMSLVLAFGADRSGEWRSVRNAHVATHPACEACGSVESREVHHVKPVSLYPESELDAANLITLCPRCHLTFGHLGNTRAHNPLVREDAARYLARVKARPYTREESDKFKQRFATAL